MASKPFPTCSEQDQQEQAHGWQTFLHLQFVGLAGMKCAAQWTEPFSVCSGAEAGAGPAGAMQSPAGQAAGRDVHAQAGAGRRQDGCGHV